MKLNQTVIELDQITNLKSASRATAQKGSKARFCRAQTGRQAREHTMNEVASSVMSGINEIGDEHNDRAVKTAQGEIFLFNTIGYGIHLGDF